jgi:hypothetical protein
MIKKLIITITLMATLMVGAIGIIYAMNNSVDQKRVAADERNNGVESIEVENIETENIEVENIKVETIKTY